MFSSMVSMLTVTVSSYVVMVSTFVVTVSKFIVMLSSRVVTISTYVVMVSNMQRLSWFPLTRWKSCAFRLPKRIQA